MAKCPKCNKEVSRKVLPMHIKRCEGIKEIEEHTEITEEIKDLENELEESEEEIRAKAKELGISNWWNKSIENIIEEMEA